MEFGREAEIPIIVVNRLQSSGLKRVTVFLMEKHDERLLWLGGAHLDEATFNKAFGRVLAKLRGSDDFNPTRTAQHSRVDRAFLYAVERGEKGILVLRPISREF